MALSSVGLSNRYHTAWAINSVQGQDMRVVITGGAGFLGSRLARRILERGTLIGADGAQHTVRELVLFDVVPAANFDDPRVRIMTGDVADPATVQGLIGEDTQSVFHLAAIVSGQAEAEFDLGIRTRHAPSARGAACAAAAGAAGVLELARGVRRRRA